MTWRLARSLETLRDEVNASAPNRNKASDGTIGDTSHSARASDHNPNGAGVVRAIDLTNDPAGGFSAADLAADVARLLGNHPALGSGAYVIWDSRIISTDRRYEGWRPYSGSNPHNKHVHISVATSAAGYDSTTPWLTEDDDMANYADQLGRIEVAQKDAATDLAKLTKRFDRFADNSWRREAALAKALKDQGVDVDAILAKVTEE